MATARQVAANRENAKRSTGPRSPEGKASVRYNALTHGLLARAALLPDEDELTFDQFSNAIMDDLDPNGQVETVLAERIVNILWRLRRLSHVEAGLFVHHRAANEEQRHRGEARSMELYYAEFLSELSPLTSRDPYEILDGARHAEAIARAEQASEMQQTPLAQLGAAFARDADAANAFSKLARYETTLVRDLDRTLTSLRVRQEGRLS